MRTAFETHVIFVDAGIEFDLSAENTSKSVGINDFSIETLHFVALLNKCASTNVPALNKKRQKIE